MSFNSSLRGRALKRSVLATGAALVLAGSAVGVVGAQQAAQATPVPGTPGQAQVRPAHDQFIAALAAKLGLTVDRLNQAIVDTRTQLGLPQGRPAPFGHAGGPRGGPGFGRGAPLDTAAQALGITADQLRQELPGKTLTGVAKAHNVDPAKVATALKTAATTHIDQDVIAGRLTADQATQARQRASDEIDQLMTRPTPVGQPGPRGDRGGRPTA